jgi:hypothetical protein
MPPAILAKRNERETIPVASRSRLHSFDHSFRARHPIVGVDDNFMDLARFCAYGARRSDLGFPVKSGDSSRVAAYFVGKQFSYPVSWNVQQTRSPGPHGIPSRIPYFVTTFLSVMTDL